jgi:FkbM family methyltransferase
MNPRIRLSNLIQNGLRRFGYELHPYPAPPRVDYADRRRERLLRSRKITLLLDVGANTGEFAASVRASGYAGRIVSFEPLSEPHVRLLERSSADPRWDVRKLALGDTDGSAEINVAGNIASSSLLPMGSRHLQSAPESAYVARERIEAARLDTVWDDLASQGDRVWLKLDVQGYELHALRGVEAVLDRIEVVQAEMGFQHLYEGDATWHELIDWLEARGFRLAGLEPGFEDASSGELLQADGIFVRADPA